MSQYEDVAKTVVDQWYDEYGFNDLGSDESLEELSRRVTVAIAQCLTPLLETLDKVARDMAGHPGPNRLRDEVEAMIYAATGHARIP